MKQEHSDRDAAADHAHDREPCHMCLDCARCRALEPHQLLAALQMLSQERRRSAVGHDHGSPEGVTTAGRRWCQSVRAW
jgi:hypothetical protein